MYDGTVEIKLKVDANTKIIVARFFFISCSQQFWQVGRKRALAVSTSGERSADGAAAKVRLVTAGRRSNVFVDDFIRLEIYGPKLSYGHERVGNRLWLTIRGIVFHRFS